MLSLTRSRTPATLLRWTCWTAIVALSALVVANTLPYFSLRPEFDFLVEKGALAFDPIWRSAFFFHIAGAIVCLVTGPLLMSRRLLRWARWAHRVLGWAYVLCALCISGPSALYLALHAKGGSWGTAGFLVLGVAWMATTFLGLRAIQQRRMQPHVSWMARSYALTLSALSFRVIQIGLFLGGVPDAENYVLSLWLSFAVSIATGEWAAARLRAGLSRIVTSPSPSPTPSPHGATS